MKISIRHRESVTIIAPQGKITIGVGDIALREAVHRNGLLVHNKGAGAHANNGAMTPAVKRQGCLVDAILGSHCAGSQETSANPFQ